MLYLYVMERGFVLVGLEGNRSLTQDACFLSLNKLSIVRTWGTSKGLGQLAFEGPLTGTILDREPDGTEIHRDSIYRRIPCDMNAPGWKRYLEGK